MTELQVSLRLPTVNIPFQKLVSDGNTKQVLLNSGKAALFPVADPICS